LADAPDLGLDHSVDLRPDHVTILATDPVASESHYDRLLPLLGFERRKPGIWVSPGGFHIQLAAARPGTSAYERYGAGVNHLGFGAPSAAFVENLHRALVDCGGNPPDLQYNYGTTALFLKDPDGFRIEVTYYPPEVSVVN